MEDAAQPMPPADELQFERAEYKTPQEVLSCKACQASIQDTYFTVDAVVLCPTCRAGFGDGRHPVTFAALAKAAWFGFLAAVLGAVIWRGITQLTGLNIGFVAVIVGILIGNAVRRNGDGQGGWMFQAIAILMTYICLTLSFIPDVITATTNIMAKHDVSSGSLAWYLLFAFLLVTAPVMISFSSILSLLINGFAFYQAWKVNKWTPMVIAGPLRTGSRDAPSLVPEVPASG
jgi:hypothetical protein